MKHGLERASVTSKELAGILENLQKKCYVAQNGLLAEEKSRSAKDILLDKSTIRFMQYIDWDIALQWIESQEKI